MVMSVSENLTKTAEEQELHQNKAIFKKLATAEEYNQWKDNIDGLNHKDELSFFKWLNLKNP